jgi:hypothetical protein
MVHDASVVEVVQEQAREPREGDTEVVEGVHAHPEGAAIVPEEIVLYGDALGRGRGEGGEAAGVEEKPGVPRGREGAQGEGRRRSRCETSCYDGAGGAGEEDAVDVVGGGCCCFFLQFGHGVRDRGSGVVRDLDVGSQVDKLQLHTCQHPQRTEAPSQRLE